jgi:transcriptional regulator with XRE-family HTH domain
MARAALGWSTQELARRADVGGNTINRFEQGQDARVSSVDKLRATLEAAGVIFVAENGEGPGVRLRKGLDQVTKATSSASDMKASADDARGQADAAADRAMVGAEGTDEEKSARRDRLTAVPASVKKARGRRKL